MTANSKATRDMQSIARR